jgi:translation initiation factor 3 subunit J
LRNACVFVSEEEQLAPIDLKLHEPPKLKWEDEDVDEDDVKDSWEEEDEPAPVRTI